MLKGSRYSLSLTISFLSCAEASVGEYTARIWVSQVITQ